MNWDRQSHHLVAGCEAILKEVRGTYYSFHATENKDLKWCGVKMSRVDVSIFLFKILPRVIEKILKMEVKRCTTNCSTDEDYLGLLYNPLTIQGI